jgi:hypothetical protein
MRVGLKVQDGIGEVERGKGSHTCGMQWEEQMATSGHPREIGMLQRAVTLKIPKVHRQARQLKDVAAIHTKAERG